MCLCLDPLDPTDHVEGIVNIVTGLIASDSENVDKAVDIGKSQMTIFESSLSQEFYGGKYLQVSSSTDWCVV